MRPQPSGTAPRPRRRWDPRATRRCRRSQLDSSSRGRASPSLDASRSGAPAGRSGTRAAATIPRVTERTPRGVVPAEKPAGTGPEPAERFFLEGPRSRKSEPFSVFQIALEFVTGFRTVHFVGPCVSFFGSARFHPDHPYYTLAREAGSALARLGFTVMTGGGPGIMEAANRGAREAGGRSVGCNIALPVEQKLNP